jgi:hypothetical protein
MHTFDGHLDRVRRSEASRDGEVQRRRGALRRGDVKQGSISPVPRLLRRSRRQCRRQPQGLGKMLAMLFQACMKIWHGQAPSEGLIDILLHSTSDTLVIVETDSSSVVPIHMV